MGGCVSLQLSCDQVLNQACCCLFGDGNYIHMMEANLEALQKTMQELQERRDDLLRRVSMEEDRGLQRLAQVQGWVLRVAALESQVSDLLKAKSTQTKRLCLLGFCSSKCISSYDYGKMVLKKLNEVKELLCKGVFEVLAEKIPAARVEKKYIETTIGLDAMVEKAWNSLMNDERTTLGLYGMGGVGKTTLLARLNNKFIQEVNVFDVVIWVVVSKDLQYESIQNQILGRIRSDKEWKQDSEEEKASSIHSILTRKKFVLLLDDLWSEVNLNMIGVPPPTQDNGSKIVFTTRLKEVCKDMKADDEMKVPCLSPDEAWELFRKRVGEIPLTRHQDILKLARKVAEKCCGLPLALNVIGKAMACKEDVHEWRHAIDVLNSSSHEFPGMEEKILSILKFSYDGLVDENIKSCFLYCSLFPEDYEIKKEELIEYWINEGLIKGNRDEDRSNNHGHAIIGLLVRAHLLLEGQFTTIVKMHDVLREMALWIGSNCGKETKYHCVKTGAQLSRIPDDINWRVARRISLMSNQIARISCYHSCPNLLTLLLRSNKLEDIIDSFFCDMPFLVVLDLSENKWLSVLPNSVASLHYLQYLNLSSTSIKQFPLPAHWWSLRKLKSLNLEFTSKLECIAELGTRSPNLQVLKLFCSRVVLDANVMKELQQLKHLEVLTATVNDAMILESIQGVEQLASRIRGLCLWHMSEEVVVFNTVALSGLQQLAIRESKISEIKIELQCTSSSPGFKHLSTVYIDRLEGSKDLTWLLFAQNLRYLTVTRSQSIEDILDREKGLLISNMHPDISVPFGKLESLELTNLYSLERICSSPPALPNLRKFAVVQCCLKLPRDATEFPILEHA